MDLNQRLDKDPFDYLENQIDELIWVNDPEGSYKYAKEILSTLGIPYSALKRYDVVKVLKYQK